MISRELVEANCLSESKIEMFQFRLFESVDGKKIEDSFRLYQWGVHVRKCIVVSFGIRELDREILD